MSARPRSIVPLVGFLQQLPWSFSYPAGVRIEEPPPYAVCSNLLHPAAPIQEDCQHALPQVNDLLVLLGVGRVRRVIGHGMLLGYWRNNERRMKASKGIA